jgi:hypothetical protein
MSLKSLDQINQQKEQKIQSKVEDLMLNKLNMPIKGMIMDIENNIADVKIGINRNNKIKSSVSEELKTLQNNSFNKINNITKLIMEDLINFTKDLDKLKQLEIEQNEYITEQIKYLNKDNQILSHTLSSIDNYISKQEDSVGMDFYK